MNNGYFNKEVFPGNPINMNNINLPNQTTLQTQAGNFPMEQSYIENILRMNKGKKVTVHMTFPDSNEWRDKEFKGIIEQSGRDHIILSDPTNGVWYLLLMIYIDYVTFEEKINYELDFSFNN